MNRTSHNSPLAKAIKNLPAMQKMEVDMGSIRELGRSPEEGKGYPLQCSSLENSMEYTVLGVAKSQTQFSGFHFSLDAGSCLNSNLSL